MIIKKMARQIATLIFGLVLSINAYAGPQTLNYQGYLADALGTPLDAPVNITFAIYDFDIGGTALWSETVNVVVSNGLFQTELGFSNPIPENVFDTDFLYLGLSVETDDEMVPRQQLSSVPFANKAEDAKTLDGISAFSLDQSAHVVSSSNPHNVTAAQVGALGVAALTTHSADVAAHHSKFTNAEATAAMGAKSDANPLNHDKYTDGNAVAAMGAKTANNPLNHDQYTDLAAVTAIKAADGSGSTLDADLLDGMDSAAIISAASNMVVGMPISSLPFTVNSSGSYYLASSLQANSTSGIIINADNVTIDMMGFSLEGNGNGSGLLLNGITISGDNVTVQNGVVTSFGGNGIDINDSNLAPTDRASIRIINMVSAHNGDNGFFLGFGQRSSFIFNSTAKRNNGAGFIVGQGSTVINSVAKNNDNLGFNIGSGSIVKSNIASDNSGSGFSLQDRNIVTNNAANNNSTSGFTFIDGNTVKSNTSNNNGEHGIIASSNNYLVGNICRDNGNIGIVASNENKILGNILDGNQSGNMSVGGNSIIEENFMTSSQFGIGFSSSTPSEKSYFNNNKLHGHVIDYQNLVNNIDGGGNVSF